MGTSLIERFLESPLSRLPAPPHAAGQVAEVAAGTHVKFLCPFGSQALQLRQGWLV